MAIDPNIKQKAENIRLKKKGREVRESLAAGLEAMSEDVVSTVARQGNVEGQFQEVIDNTTGKDVISAPELIAARNGEANLKDRLDKEQQQVNAQLAHKAQQTTALSLQSQLDSLVISSGQADNAEIAQARTDDHGNVFPLLKGNLDNIYSILESNVGRVSFGDWVSGAVESSGFENTLNTFIRTSGFHTFESGKIVEITPSNGYKIRIARYEEDGTFISVSGFSADPYKLYPISGRQYKFSIAYDDTTAITPSDATNVYMQSEATVKTKAKGAEYVDVSPNLINPRKISNNAVINASTGVVESSSTYGVTDFIPLAPGQVINPTRYRNYALYDADRNFLFAEVTETTTNTTVVNNTFPKLAYIRFTIRNTYLNEAMVSYDPIVRYEKYGLKIPDLNVGEMNFTEEAKQYILSLLDSSVNPLSGKSVYGFGDSLVAGHHSGEGFLDGLTEENAMNYTKYAVNGSRIIGDIYGQMNNASTTIPDFIVFDGLTNDAYDDVVANNLGVLSADYDGVYDMATFYGAFESICYLARTKYTSASVIYVTPHKMPTRSAKAQETLVQAAKEVCQKWSIPVVDIYNEGQINTNITVMKNDYSYDNAGETSGGNGTHLPGAAYDKFYAPRIESAMLATI